MAQLQHITMDCLSVECSLCRQKTFQFRIVYRGGSYDALLGAANTTVDGDD